MGISVCVTGLAVSAQPAIAESSITLYLCSDASLSQIQAGCADGSGAPVVVQQDQNWLVQNVSGFVPTSDIVVRGYAEPSLTQQAAQSWGPYFTSALEESAALRGVSADSTNQNAGLAEARALLVQKAFAIIDKHRKGEALDAQEQAAYDQLTQTVSTHQKLVAAKEQADLNGVDANPCGDYDLNTGTWITRPWQVPVGDPMAYYKSIEPACLSSISNQLGNDYPLPTPEQFREWARSQTMVDQLKIWGTGYDPNLTGTAATLKVIDNDIQSQSPWLTDAEATAQARDEYEHALASLDRGFAFLAAEKALIEKVPTEERTEAESEVLAQINEGLIEFGYDRYKDAIADMYGSLWEFLELPGMNIAEGQVDVVAGPLTQQAALAELQNVAAANLDGLVDAGLAGGTAIAGAVSALAIETGSLVQRQQTLDAIQSDVEQANAPVDLDSLAMTENGRTAIVDALVKITLPDNTAWDATHDDAIAPAATAGDLTFNVRPINGQTRQSQELITRDWASNIDDPNGTLFSVSGGWLTRAHINGYGAKGEQGTVPQNMVPTYGDAFVGPRRYDTALSYVDWSGDWWRAWLVGDTFLQVRYADHLEGRVTVANSVQGTGSGPCPPGDSIGLSSGTVLGPRCVLGDGTHFKSDLKPGDTIQVGSQVKRVAVVDSDTALETETPFRDVLPREQGVVRVNDVGSDCFDAGLCVTSPTIRFASGTGYLYEATVSGNVAPTVDIGMSTALTPAFLGSGSGATGLTVGTGRSVTFQANAADANAGDHLTISWSVCMTDSSGTGSCQSKYSRNLDAAAAAADQFTVAFPSVGFQTVEVAVSDEHGATAHQSYGVNVVPSAPQWQLGSDQPVTMTVGQPATVQLGTVVGTPVPRISTLFTGVTLPAGLTLTDNGDGTAVISGTPPAGSGGTYTISLEATASSAAYPQPDGTFVRKSRSDFLDIPLTINEAPSIGGLPLPTATVDSGYLVSLDDGGAFPAATFSITDGSLPSGLQLSPTGTISGTPIHAGSTSFTIAATNAGGTTRETTFLTVNKADQSISFPGPDTGTQGATYRPRATATSGLSTTISVAGVSTPESCAVSGGTVTFTSAGLCVLTASQDGNSDYNPAPPATHIIAVTNAFLGFQAPLSQGKTLKANATIAVKFTVGSLDGTARSTKADTQVLLSTRPFGSGAILRTAGCSYSTAVLAYKCNVRPPSSVKTGGTAYYLTVFQRVPVGMGDWLVMRDGIRVTNPNSVRVYFK